MAIRKRKIIDTTLNDVTTAITAALDLNGITPRKITLLVQIVKSGAPTNVILTTKTSPDSGLNLIAYDKLESEAGTDGPAASVTYTTTGDDTISFAAEDVVDYFSVTLTGTDTGASATFACKVWALVEY